MTCCDSLAAFSCWSLHGVGEQKRTVLSRRPNLFFRRKTPVYTREQEKVRLLESHEHGLSSKESMSEIVTECTASPVPRKTALKKSRSNATFETIISLEALLSGSIRTTPEIPPNAFPAGNCISAPVQRPATAETQPRKVQTSRLLALPQEIRDEIYAYVFYSTRLTAGRRVTCVKPSSDSPNDRIITKIKSARNSLALFKVCRQITNELRSDEAWLGQVLFNFEDVATMIDVLGGVLATPERRGRVREVRVREGGLMRQTPHRGTCRFLMGGLMRLLPGLNLDRLTVLPALPCRVHGTECLYKNADSGRAGPHEILNELVRFGCGWRELCYVHHDDAMLSADRRRPGSLEAMMVNMGFWNSETENYDDVFAAAEGRPFASERVDAATLAMQASPLRRHRHRFRLGSLFASYAEKKEYRLPRWRALLAERDATCRDSQKGKCPEKAPQKDANSTIDVYGLHDGLPSRFIETLADVHENRMRGNDFMVVVRRGKAFESDWLESGVPYPYADGDPRTLGYGTSWEALRSFLFAWDYVPATRSRRDQYIHRDEYVVGPRRKAHLDDHLCK